MHLEDALIQSDLHCICTGTHLHLYRWESNP